MRVKRARNFQASETSTLVVARTHAGSPADDNAKFGACKQLSLEEKKTQFKDHLRQFKGEPKKSCGGRCQAEAAPTLVPAHS